MWAFNKVGRPRPTPTSPGMTKIIRTQSEAIAKAAPNVGKCGPTATSAKSTMAQRTMKDAPTILRIAKAIVSAQHLQLHLPDQSPRMMQHMVFAGDKLSLHRNRKPRTEQDR
eukprot:GHVU01207552.1.p2 GENE.GHVU01207552.1~~GHVU01207552.1.p2  ORF type:complete len:112 (-),score=7.44 GHVU01207552.1:115-450(-)